MLDGHTNLYALGFLNKKKKKRTAELATNVSDF